MNESRLPFYIQWLVNFFCREDLADNILGDLEELYDRRLSTQATWKARFLLMIDVLFFFRPFALKRFFKNSNTSIMLSNHLKISFRKVRKYQASSLTKMLSLTVGMVSVFFISLYIHHEMSYDHFHSKREKIYTLNTTVESPTGDLALGLTATGVIPYLKEASSAIDAAIRINHAYGSHVIRNGDKRFIESENIYFADEDFFKVFDFTLIDGNYDRALAEPLNVVLTSIAAHKYFGTTNVLGRSLEIDEHTYTVSGVIDVIPHNSHLQFDFLLSMESFLATRPSAGENWTWMPMNSFVLLKEEANLSSLEELISSIPAYQIEGGPSGYQVSLESFADIHFSEIQLGKLEASGNLQNIYILAGVGLMILLLACFNYINLTTATVSLQQKEVSLKKTIGASKGHVFLQFMVESVVITVFSTVMAIVLILLVFHQYEAFLDTRYGLEYLLKPASLAILMGLPLLLAFAGGVYPAIKFSNIGVGQAQQKRVIRNYLLDTRSALLIFQFGITSVLIIGSLVIYGQLHFIKNQDLGFDHKQKIVIDYGPNAAIGNQFEMLSSKFEAIPGVVGVTFSSHIPGEKPNGVTTILTDQEGIQRTGDISLTLVDPGFIERYGLSVIAGRDFRSGPADASSALIVNESCAKAYGFDNPEDIVGQSFQQWGGDGKVIGVISDFNYLSLHQEVGLLSLKVWPDQFQKITVNLSSNDISGVLKRLETQWDSLYPNIPFNYFFLDDSFSEQYRADDIFMTIINIFSLIAVFIGLLGLISFTSFWVDRKQREMSIRKVLGAKVGQILWQFIQQFTLPVLIGFVLATPLAFYFGKSWISQFAYQLKMTPLTFVVPFLIILVLATTIIGAQTIRVVGDNPVDHLKQE